MRTSAVEVAIVSLPLARPVITPIHRIESIDNVLVTARTDEGIDGVAYLWCFGAARAQVLAAAVRDLGACVVGADPRQTVRLWDRMWREANFFGRAGVVMFALSALDVALWDIRARQAGMPLWRLLGGAPDPVPVYANGLFLSDPLEDIVAEARRYAAQGFRAVKMRTGAAREAEDIERVAAVREALGPEVAIMIDVVQGWDVERAIRVGRALERYGIAWLEDPVAFDDHAGMARVAAALDVPLCAGENDYARTGFRRLLEQRSIDIALADLQRVGGITEWLRVADLAEAAGVRTTSHVFHEISVHLMAARPSPWWTEWMQWWEPLFRETPALADGCLVPPERPGLGIEFDWDRVDRFRLA